MLEIKEVCSEEYRHKQMHFAYETKGYYDLKVDGFHYQFVYTPFETAQTKGFDDELLSDWLENPVLFGAYIEDEMVGFIEGSMEQWNGRFRISNLFVEKGYRKHHVAGRLLTHMMEVAKHQHARMLVLETQSCNIPAIHCYLKNGFEIIGFDTHAFSNQDIQNHEIRIEMGKIVTY